MQLSYTESCRKLYHFIRYVLKMSAKLLLGNKDVLEINVMVNFKPGEYMRKMF